MTIAMSEYQARTAYTAIYPGAGTRNGITYVILGLVGELSELLDNPHDTSEAGDVLWYLAQAHICLDTDLPEPGDEILALSASRPPYLTPSIVAAGRLAEHAKKAIRDDYGMVTDRRRAAMLNVLGTLTEHFYIALGSEVAEIAAANLDKLASRKVRGVLSGEGDQR